MKYIVGFFRFWYDFIIGDDWTIAVIVAVTLAVVDVLAHHGLKVWWLLAVVVILALGVSLQRAARAG